MRYEIKALNVGGVLDQSIALLKHHFKVLVTITLFLYIPILLVIYFVDYALLPVQGLSPSGVPKVELGFTFLLINFIGGLVLVFLAVPITNAAVVRAVANEYLDHPTSAQESFKYALTVLLPLMVTSILAWSCIFLGYIIIIAGIWLTFQVPAFLPLLPILAWSLVFLADLVLILLGFWLTFRYWFTSYIVVIEGTKGWAALERSGALMKGHMTTAFVLTLLLSIIGSSLGIAKLFIPVQLVSLLVYTLIQAALFIFGGAASVVFYFSCRCQLDHFDLTVLAETIGREGSKGGIRESGLTTGGMD
ncbi:MAG: hypothetical protein ACE5HC_05510 [Candidatus Binatia bacterium]